MNRYLQLFFSLLKMVSVPLLNFLTLFIGIKFYGKENWGEFISISIWIYFIAFVAKWSGQHYLIKELSKNVSNYLSVFYSNLIERAFLLLPSLVLFFLLPVPLACSALLTLLLLFVSTSFETLLIFKQKLQLHFFIELAGIVSLFTGFYLFPEFNLTTIFYLFSASYLVKIILVVTCVRLSCQPVFLSFSLRNLIKSFPYFLIGFSGWLASKCDIYVVSIFFTKKEISEYQILMSSFLMLQALPAYLILPITTHLFRLSDVSTNKIQRKISWLALPIVAFFSLVIWCILVFFMQIKFSFLIYFFAALSCLPTFFYTVEVTRLYKQNKEKTIMYSCFMLFLVTLFFMWLLLPMFKILGMVMSVCIAQWVYLFFIYKRSKNV